MIAYVNGQFVSDEAAVVSVYDRGFLYGDGLFETIPVCHGRPFRWGQHLDRMHRGAAALGMRVPLEPSALLAVAAELIRRNRRPESILRLGLSRGVGARGYSPAGATQPTLVLTLHEAPCGESERALQWRLVTALYRVPVGDRLGQFKHSSRLLQVLARAEAEAAGADEAVVLNTQGEVVETAAGNLFWVCGGVVGTAPVALGALPGITRGVVLEICGRLGIPAREAVVTREQLAQAKVQALFVTLSSFGVVEAVSWDGESVGRAAVVEQIRHAYRGVVELEAARK
ncbi:MAG: hypothetical protein FJ387_03380 [Verrucomicrobia bacterium]|nr:hypothetical protein [Verrucomicrobiota bacterium]